MTDPSTPARRTPASARRPILVAAALFLLLLTGGFAQRYVDLPGQASSAGSSVPGDRATSGHATGESPQTMVPGLAAPKPPTPTPTPPGTMPTGDGSGAAAAPTLAGTPGPSILVSAGPGKRQEIALTFDAGADRGNAEAILDILAAYGVHATFGVTGAWAEANPDLIRRMVDEGHQVVNHTWSHRSLTGQSTSSWDPGITDPVERSNELRSTAAVIQEIAGYDVRPWFRPPYGDYDAGLLEQLGSEGYAYTLMWTCDTLGWSEVSVDDILDRCASDPVAGDIILMHVGEASADVDALPSMIERFTAAGFTLVTAEQLEQP